MAARAVRGWRRCRVWSGATRARRGGARAGTAAARAVARWTDQVRATLLGSNNAMRSRVDFQLCILASPCALPVYESQPDACACACSQARIWRADSGKLKHEAGVGKSVFTPPSWVTKLAVPRDLLDTRVPKGTKKVVYQFSEHELFALFGETSKFDGCAERLTIFTDEGHQVKLEVCAAVCAEVDCEPHCASAWRSAVCLEGARGVGSRYRYFVAHRTSGCCNL